jgi:hypothetical protein
LDRSSSQQCAAAVPLDLDLAEAVQIMNDMLPFKVAVTACSETVEELLSQQHCKGTAEHVSTDGLLWKIGRAVSNALAVLEVSSTASKLR